MDHSLWYQVFVAESTIINCVYFGFISGEHGRGFITCCFIMDKKIEVNKEVAQEKAELGQNSRLTRNFK